MPNERVIRSSFGYSSPKTYPVGSGWIDILQVMGFFRVTIRMGERNAGWRERRRLNRNTNPSR